MASLDRNCTRIPTNHYPGLDCSSRRINGPMRRDRSTGIYGWEMRAETNWTQYFLLARNATCRLPEMLGGTGEFSCSSKQLLRANCLPLYVAAIGNAPQRLFSLVRTAVLLTSKVQHNGPVCIRLRRKASELHCSMWIPIVTVFSKPPETAFIHSKNNLSMRLQRNMLEHRLLR